MRINLYEIRVNKSRLFEFPNSHVVEWLTFNVIPNLLDFESIIIINI